TKLIEDLANPQRDAYDHLERSTRSRVEIDDRVVGVIQAANARHPGVERDAAELHEVQERRQIAADKAALRFALSRDVVDPNGLRRIVRRVLLEEQFAVHAIGCSFEDEWTVGNRGQD